MLCVKVNSNTIELTPCYWVLDLFCVILWLEGHKKAKFVWRHFWMTLPGSRSVCQKSFHGLGKEMPSSDLSVPWVLFFWDGQRREGVSQFHLAWEQSIAASICPTFLSSSAERERTTYLRWGSWYWISLILKMLDFGWSFKIWTFKRPDFGWHLNIGVDLRWHLL